MPITPEFALVAVLTTGVGFAMMRLGVRKGLLRARSRIHRCPSCGRMITTSFCTYCTHP